VEEQFYLVWPFVVLFLSRGALLRACFLIGLGALALRFAMALLRADPILTFVLTPSRIDTLAAGGALACFAREPRGLSAIPARWIVAGSGAFVAGLFAMEHGLRSTDDVVRTLGFTGLAVFFAGLLALVLGAPEGSRLGRAFAHPWLRALGKYSYALYLLHGPIGSFLTGVVKPETFPRVLGSELPGMIAYNAACFAVSLAAAVLSWHLVEKHFLSLKRFFRGDRVRAPTVLTRVFSPGAGR
jgi:peptidoglycan/LPS O-acetylase OafA/YrhL